MNATPRLYRPLLAALLPVLVLTGGLAADPAAAADLAGKAYLSRVAASAGPDAVTVRLRIRGAAVPSVSYRPGLVQITLRDAFLDPAKQRVPVDHPTVSEVVAYQLDPDTVRVRILTPGVDARKLADTAVLTPEAGGLRLVLRGLPAPAPETAAAPALPAPGSAPAPVVTAQRDSAPDATPKPAPEAPADTLTEVDLNPVAPVDATEAAEAPAPFPRAGEDTALAAAEARTRALEAFERILAEDGSQDAPGPVPANEVAWLAGVRPDAGAQGGGSPALAGPSRTLPDAAPAAGEPTAKPAAPAAHAPSDTHVPAAARAPLTTLPAGAAAPSLVSSGLKMAGGLLVVLALLLAGMTVLRRVRGTAFGGAMPIRVLASASVGGRQNIVVVEVEGRRLVVGVGPAGMELLADLAEGAPAAADATGTGPAAPASTAPVRAVPAPGRGETRFARILKAAGRKAAPARRGDPAADAVARATRDLARHVRRLRERAV